MYAKLKYLFEWSLGSVILTIMTFLQPLVERDHMTSLHALIFRSVRTKSGADLFFGLSHTDSDFYESVGDSFVASELHELWGHWDTEFFGHLWDFVLLWLSLESGWNSLKGLLGVHKSLKLSSWVSFGNIVLVLGLLLSSLLISLGNSGIHLGLHLLELLSGGFYVVLFLCGLRLSKGLSFGSWLIISKLHVFWHQASGDLFSWIVNEVTSVLLVDVHVLVLNKGHSRWSWNEGDHSNWVNWFHLFWRKIIIILLWKI